MESKENISEKKFVFWIRVFIRSIDNTRVGVSFARKRTIGGRRGGGGGGSYNNGGDRYPRGDRDDSRYRRRYSPRPSNDR